MHISKTYTLSKTVQRRYYIPGQELGEREVD